MKELTDSKAIDIATLVKYVVWSKDKVAGGVSQENAMHALSRLIDYPIDLMNKIAAKE
jgi:hypothetical protein